MVRLLTSLWVLVCLYAPVTMANTTLTHQTWSQLLQAHVVATDDGASTAVDYAGFAQDQATFQSYLTQLSSVSNAQFEEWSEADQLAFLINAYNAFTVALILTKWPDLESIKDIGGWFSSPWKQAFISLLGEKVSLDHIEHTWIRGVGRYEDPRIHFAVNCASIGCPALRNEAYTGAQLNDQLNQQTRQFLSDRSRNRLDQGTVYLSSIFKWYREDFEKGWRGYSSLGSFLADYGDALGATESQRRSWRESTPEVSILSYDWRLNSIR